MFGNKCCSIFQIPCCDWILKTQFQYWKSITKHKLMTQLDMVIQIIRLKWVEFVASVLIYCHTITIITQCCVSMSWIAQEVWLEADPHKGTWILWELVCREIGYGRVRWCWQDQWLRNSRYSLWLDVGRDDGLGGQWMGVARIFRSR